MSTSAPPATSPLLHALSDLTDKLGHMAGNLFLSPGSTFSLLSLGFATLIAVVFLLLGEGKPRRLRVLIRALFPQWLWRHKSMRADIGFFALNVFVTGSLIGWGLLSYSAISHGTEDWLTRSFGAIPYSLPPVWSHTLLTIVLFLAYDGAYWLDHYLKHKVPFLWEFHRVHHTAEVLSPLTAFRMHPIDSLIFYNITAVIMGATHGLTSYGLGGNGHEATLSGTNIILVAFIFTTIHLQHSHINLRFGGLWGKVLFSPAHHHIHHSAAPEHYDKNLGSCLAIWDWMFGTLSLPSPENRPVEFGAGGQDTTDPHSVTGTLITPFIRAIATLKMPVKKTAPIPEMPLPEALREP